MSVTKQENIFGMWIVWQFVETPKFLFGVWNNYMSFAASYFSFTQLIKSFFSPWHKYKWAYPKAFDIGGFFNTFISNTVSRFLGALMRVVLIVIGALFQVFVAIAGLIIFLSWLLVPFIIIAGILFVLFL